MSEEKAVARGLVLNVPFNEKDEAKRLGARWDPDMRKWFVPRGLDVRKFEKWDPSAKPSITGRGEGSTAEDRV